MAHDIFNALSDLRMVLNTETDADSPDNETTYGAIRKAIECLFTLMLGTTEAGTFTQAPSGATLTDSAATFTVDAHIGRTIVITDGDAIGNFYTIDDNASQTIIVTGDDPGADGVQSGDSYRIFYDLKTHDSGHTHDDVDAPYVVLADDQVVQAKVADDAVGQAQLKSTTGSVSSTNTTGSLETLPGGQYGFYPRHYCSNNNPNTGLTIKAIGIDNEPASYTTTISVTAALGSAAVYATQRYVTASGDIHWIFFLRWKETGEIAGLWQSSDHPCLGNGDNPEIVPHPFFRYDPVVHELFVTPLKNDDPILRDIKSKVKPNRDFLQVIREEYDFDESLPAPSWPTKEITVGLGEKWDVAYLERKKVQVKKQVIPQPKNIKTIALRRK